MTTTTTSSSGGPVELLERIKDDVHVGRAFVMTIAKVWAPSARETYAAVGAYMADLATQEECDDFTRTSGFSDLTDVVTALGMLAELEANDVERQADNYPELVEKFGLPR